MSAQPYGPNTPAIRRFLVRLAGLGTGDRGAVVQAYTAHCEGRAWLLAESALATSIERSAREPQRDALTGPLLQLVRPTALEGRGESEAEVMAALDPIAEPALAALLALIAQDLLDQAHFEALYAPFADTIPLPELLPPTRV